MTAYVHNLDPVILHLGETLALRWYGLAYVLGFLLGYWLLRSLSRRNLWCLPPEKIGDFVMFAAVFGVLLGGRLGYIFFYYIRKVGWDGLAEDPLVVLRVWEGGMASHGGLIGLIVFTLFYARRHQVSWAGLLDGLAMAAPIGIFFGRMANFINGELYGRIAHASSWAMKFPMEMWERPVIARQALVRLHAEGHRLVPDYPDTLRGEDIEKLIQANRHDPEVTRVLSEFLTPRHPSQLYEAFAEGLLIFVVLYAVRVLFPKAGNGFLSGLFCLMYAAGRIIVECYREPDSPLVGALTMGQFLSSFMILAGVVFLIYSFRNREPIGWKTGKE